MPRGTISGGTASGPMSNGFGKRGDKTWEINLSDDKGGGSCMEVAAPAVVVIGLVAMRLITVVRRSR